MYLVRLFWLRFSYARIDEIRISLQEAGFRRIEISSIPYEHAIADLAPLAHGAVFGSPLFVQLSDREADHQETEKAVLTALRHEFGNEPTIIPHQAIMIAAMRP